MLEQLQKNIHYTFNQVKHLVLALTHSSYSNECSEVDGHNERLEFLGDAVLELCISELLFEKFNLMREGELTGIRSDLVSQKSLAEVALRLEIDKCLLLGRGEEEQGGRQREALLSDAFEAVLGAVFIDGGFKAAQDVVGKLFLPLFPGRQDEQEKTINGKPKDNKSLLQELTQKSFQERPVYTLLSSTGPEHSKVFEVGLILPDGQEFKASGSSLKRAEQAVAAEALKTLGAK